MRTFLIAAALMPTPIIATAQSAPTSGTPEKGTMIYVDATGRVSAVPDVAIFSISVFQKHQRRRKLYATPPSKLTT